jgi:hypothetical protein
MKTQYRYIHFVKVADKPKTSVWSCRNNSNDDELGEVRWYPAWRQYCFFPTQPAVYSVGCLVDINDFITHLPNNAMQPTLRAADGER